MKEISVIDLKKRLDAKENFHLVDVREEDEVKFCRIQGSTHIPLSEFEARYEAALKPEDDIVIHCHHGGRSQSACDFLAKQGYKNLTNVVGGIDAWSLKIDPKVPRY